MELSIEESKIVTVSRMVENFSGKRVADNAPVVGTDVFTQTSGIHADGDQKGELYQSPLSPERFGRRRSYALGKMSGKASLKKNLEELGIHLSAEDHAQVLQRIVEMGDQKTTITVEDLPFIIADVLESKDYRHIDLLSCSVTSGLDLESTVSIRVSIDGEIKRASGSGNGGFDAFIDAVRKVVPESLAFPELVDYELRIPQGGSTSALTEVLITWQGPERAFRTRGVHANQVFAGVNATRADAERDAPSGSRLTSPGGATLLRASCSSAARSDRGAPHSVRAWPRHRPARSSSPMWMGVVSGSSPILA